MRKLIGFDDPTFHALSELARDRMASLQELADEAFADLLVKYHRPVELRDALKQSLKKESGKTAAKKEVSSGRDRGGMKRAK